MATHSSITSEIYWEYRVHRLLGYDWTWKSKERILFLFFCLFFFFFKLEKILVVLLYLIFFVDLTFLLCCPIFPREWDDDKVSAHRVHSQTDDRPAFIDLLYSVLLLRSYSIYTLCIFSLASFMFVFVFFCFFLPFSPSLLMLWRTHKFGSLTVNGQTVSLISFWPWSWWDLLSLYTDCTSCSSPLFFFFPLPYRIYNTPLKREKSELTDCWAHKSREPRFLLIEGRKRGSSFFFFSLPGRIINSH